MTTSAIRIEARLKIGLSVDNSLNEEKLLIECAKENPEAFGLLYDKYYDAIYGFIFHRTANTAVSEDLTSAVFFKVLEKLHTFRWMNLPFSSWLYRIAVNEVNYFFRQNKRIFKSIDENDVDKINDTSSQTDSIVTDKELKAGTEKLFLHLHEAIGKLKPKYQEVIILRYFEEKSISEISEILNKAEGTVKSLIHRGIEKLKPLIDLSLYEEVNYE